MTTYGSILQRGSYWMVTPAPEAMIRLKRVFAGVDKGAADQVKLKRSPAVDMDLQWFMERYPFEIDPADAREMHRGAEEYRAQQRVVDGLLNGPTPTHKYDLTVTPYDYQVVADRVWAAVYGLLLADDTGLGKTVTALLGLLDPSKHPAVVVCPKSVLPQWQGVIEVMAPSLRVHMLKGSTPYRVDPTAQVLLVNYDRLSTNEAEAPVAGWAGSMAGRVRSVVFDEIQALRHTGTARYKAAKYLADACKYRLGLSATPIHNYGGEFWSVCDVLRPNELGTWDEFRREECLEEGDGDKKSDGKETKRRGHVKLRNPEAFGRRLRDRGIMLRRTRGDVGKELPPVTVIPTYVDTGEDILAAMRGQAEEWARIIVAEDKRSDAGVRKMQAAKKLSSLLRLSTGVAKAPNIAEILRTLVESGERLLVGAWHIAVHDIFAETLSDYAPAFYVGERDGRAMTDKQRADSLRRFTKQETPLLFMSLRSAPGIDGLQHCCRNVFHAELDYTAVIHDQFRDRVDRPGQLERVMEYFALSRRGSDPLVQNILGEKRLQSSWVLDLKADTAANGAILSSGRRMAEMVLGRAA